MVLFNMDPLDRRLPREPNLDSGSRVCLRHRMTDERAKKLAMFIRTNLLQVDDAPLDLDTSLVDNGSLDSMGSTLLAAFIEEQFGVTLDEQSVSPNHLGTIRQILALINERRGQAGGLSAQTAPPGEVS